MNILELTNESLGKFLKKKISGFEGSREYRDMVEGEAYYKGEQLIDFKVRLAMGDDGKLQVIKNAPNSIVKNNQYAKLVDQKVNYIFSNKPSIEHEDKNYKEKLEKFFDMRLLRTLNKTSEKTFNNAISWWYLYTDGQELKYLLLDSKEIIPIWKDNNKEKLNALIRTKVLSEWDEDEGDFKDVEYAEFYTDKGCKYFTKKENGETYEFVGEKAYMIRKSEVNDEEVKSFNWRGNPKIPFVYFRHNSTDKTLLSRVKSIQDAINTIISNFSDNMLEDSRNTILVLKGFSDEENPQIRSQINNGGVIALPGGDDMGTPEGSVDTIHIEVNSENYKTILEILKEMLIENGRGIDGKSNKNSQAPNEVNIKSMYTDIELDANKTELEFQASFEYLQWFFKKVYGFDESFEPASITFKRNIMVNEETIVNILRNSEGIISKETQISKHPYVTDATEELAKLEKEREEIQTGYPKDPFSLINEEIKVKENEEQEEKTTTS